MKFVVFSRICVAFSIFSGALMQAQSHLLSGLMIKSVGKMKCFDLLS